MRLGKLRGNERGSALVEFAIAGSVFLTALFGVIEFGRLLWTHNALKYSAQQGARYAALRKNDTASQDAVKKMVVYGDPNANTATAKPIVPGMTMAKVNVAYTSDWGIKLSQAATVQITGYQFQFSVPLIGATLPLPSYKTVMPAESAGYIPCNLSTTPCATAIIP